MAEKLDMNSKNWLNENTQFIAERFPNCVTETEDGLKVDFELLQQELSGDVVSGSKERYRLEWPGKRQAMVNANLPTTKTLRPVREDSVDFDNTENLYIEGDNLEVLKILQESYLGKIKMIYIDPPYNTGKDFVYKDNFTQDSDEYKEESGQTDEYNRRLVSNPDTSGRYHSDWLSMMYPRLKLARNLLTEDGVIFASIDRCEQANLSKLLCDVFGEKNFIENYVWESTFRPDNSSKLYRENAQYVLAFAKDFSKIPVLFGSEAGSSGDPSLTKKSMPIGTLEFPEKSVEFGIPDGHYEKGVFDSGYELLDDVTVVSGLNADSFRLSGNMIWGQQYLIEQLQAGTKILIKSKTFVPYSRKAKPGILAPTTIIPKEKATDGLRGRAELIEACGGPAFDHPKPKGLIKYLIEMVFHNSGGGIVLDFFAGSCSTGGAVLESIDKSRKLNFILCNIPEQTVQGSTAKDLGFDDVPEIGRARLKFELKKTLDVAQGFKVYRVDESNMEDVYYQPQTLDQGHMDMFASNIKADRTSEDLLTQVLLDWGLPLTLKTEKETLEGKEVFKVAGDSLYACFDEGLDEAFAKAVAAEKPLRLVVKDSAFASDTAKVNVQQLLKQLSPNTELKVL